jgi:hypothetical protein
MARPIIELGEASDTGGAVYSSSMKQAIQGDMELERKNMDRR